MSITIKTDLLRKSISVLFNDEPIETSAQKKEILRFLNDSVCDAHQEIRRIQNDIKQTRIIIEMVEQVTPLEYAQKES